MPYSRSIFTPLIRKLDQYIPMGSEQRDALGGLPVDLRHFLPAEDLVRQRQKPEGVFLVLSGFAARYKLLPDGRRQIVGICLPGDLCDVRIGLVREMDHAVGALTPVVAAVIGFDRLHAVMEAHPGLARALWWSSFVEESIAREWIVNVGYRSAFERLAHLLCELYVRLEAVGLAQNGACELPIRQSELADTLALSAVHVNRTLMELRRSGLLSLTLRRLEIHDLPSLRAAAGFDPAYLHVTGRTGVEAPPMP